MNQAILHSATERMVQAVDAIDLALSRGAFADSNTLTQIRLARTESELRRLADAVAARRERLIPGQQALPFVEAAE